MKYLSTLITFLFGNVNILLLLLFIHVKQIIATPDNMPEKISTNLIPNFYHSTHEILNKLHELANNNECKGGTTIKIEKHGEMPSLTTLLFQNNNNNNKNDAQIKKKAFFLFGEHARELISPETALRMAEDLCMLHEESKNEAMNVLSHSEVFMVPIANPLGRLSVEKGNTCQRVNENGVDMNRNWDSHWLADEDSFGSDTYPGKKAFSEPEVRTLKSLVDSYKPSMFVTVHSGTLGMYTPYAYSTDIPHDDPNDLSNMVNIINKLNPDYCQCPSGPAGKEVGYLCPGTCLDYAYDIGKTKYSFAFEIFASDADEIHRKFKEKQQQTLLEVGTLRYGHGHDHHHEHDDHHHHNHDHGHHNKGPEYSCFLQTAEESSASILNQLSPEDCVGYFNPTTKDDYERTKQKWSEAFLKMINMAHGAQTQSLKSMLPPDAVAAPAKKAIEAQLRGNIPGKLQM